MTLYDAFMIFLGTALGTILGRAIVRILGWNR